MTGNQQAVFSKARIKRQQIPQTAYKQQSADQKHERQCDLADHQRATQGRDVGDRR